MKFHKLEINNFLTIGSAAITLNDKGLVLIQGVNEDDSSATSNGVGKSSIPDALCWALYGVTAREETGDAVVNSTAKKNCSVAVMLTDGKTGYRITRYRKHKEFKNQTVVEVAEGEGYAWVDMSKGTEKETQEVINGIMGCTLDVFMAAIYAGQENMPDLPKMTDKQLKLLIEEAAGVEQLETALGLAREKLSGAKAQLEKTVATKATTEASIVEVTAMITENKQKAADFESERKGRSDAILEKNVEIKNAIVACVADIKKCDEAAIKTRHDELEKQLLSHDSYIEKERTLARGVSSHRSAVAIAESRLNTAKSAAAAVRKVIENAPEEMKKPCPECGKPHTEDELAEFITAQKIKAVAAVADLRKCEEELEAVKRCLETATNELESFRKTIPDVSAVTVEKGKLATALTQLTSLKSRAASLKKDFDMNVERANNAMTEANPHTSVIDHLEKRLTALNELLATTAKTLEDHQNAVALHESVVKVFGPAGVRAHILDTVTPFLNERTADYLSALSDGNISAVWSTLGATAKGELREKFNIEVENDKGGKSFKLLSGGEKRKVRLATMLALQDLVASRATKPIDLFVGDEIDDALDVAGLERLMSVLEKRARTRGTVLVISHNELRDWCDQVLTVSKKDGLSSLSGMLCE